MTRKARPPVDMLRTVAVFAITVTIAMCAVSSRAQTVLAANKLTKLTALEAKTAKAKTVNEEKLPHPVVYVRDVLDDRIGQMIMVGFHGRSANSRNVKEIVKLIQEGLIGGVILMERNVKSRAQLTKLTELLRAARPELPPFIAIDQEGGSVQRLSKRRGFRYTPSAASIVRRKTLDEARVIYGELAHELAEVGVNMNFGPVVDLAINKRNPIISRRGRSYGSDPAEVSKFASAFIESHRAHGVLSVAKHFPGHGSSWTDSHRRFVDLSKTWKPEELEPYKFLSEGSAPDFVMTGHLFHPNYGGKERLPASLSTLAIRDELRGELKFKGLVITDDLEMKSVRRRFKRQDLVHRAVEAGNDVILFSDPTKKDHTPRHSHRYIRDAVDD
ncbi:MAG: hypothetical protein K0U34_08415, partial [Alphaproteobacteria bacterium]|nr:hypothetical protein [Alphaproteobacteria bacterium]